MTDLLLLVAVKGSLVLLAGFAITRLLSRSTATARHLVLTATVIGLLLLPWATTALPRLELPWLPAEPIPAAGVSIDNPAKQIAPAVAGPSATAPAGTVTSTDSAAPASPTRSWSVVGLSLYLLAAAAILGRLLIGIARLWRVTRRARPRPAWRELVRSLSGHKTARAVSVATSAQVAVPLTWGWARPTILMPEAAERWAPRDVRQALQHELAHVERHDWLCQMLVELTVALHWFHPLVWIAAARQRLEAEQACDDRVLLAGAPSGDYAEQLLQLARGLGEPPCRSVGAVAMARPHDLTIRIQAILDRRSRRSPMTRTRMLSIGFFSLLPLLFIAAATLVPAGSSVSSGSTVPATEAETAGSTPLIVAAAAGDVAMVDRLIQEGADVNQAATGDNRSRELLRTPLATAARAGHVSIVERLLDGGAHVDAKPSGDATALLEAANGGHQVIVELLIAAGADVSLVQKGDGSPLISAARGGNDEVVRRLLDEGADPNVSVRGDGSPLIAAARSGNDESVRLLLSAGADPDMFVDGDENPLYHAARSGNVETIHQLVAAGADVNAEIPGDGNALIVAVKHGTDAAAEALLSAGARPDAGVEGDGNALIQAAGDGKYELVRLFIHSGADVNAGVSGDGNALIAAARNGHLEVVRLLVESGADVDRVVRGDENALIQAAGGGYREVVEYLIGQGADVNARVRANGTEVRTPLGEALRFGHDDVADLLRAHGALE